MDCFEFRSNIFTFNEGILSEVLNDSCNLHLASCNACSRLLAEFNKMEAIIVQEKAVEPNPFVATRILQHLENEFARKKNPGSTVWIHILQPAAIAFALVCGILIGSFIADKKPATVDQLVTTSENIEFLKSNLFISEFADEDKILVINK
jgi:hypothetical protein